MGLTHNMLLLLGNQGGTAPFVPTDLTGLALWLDASDLTTLFQDDAKTTPATSDGHSVGCWADKSGNGRDMLQATAGNKPLLKLGANGVNGKATVKGDGSNDYLRTATFTLTPPLQIIAVFRAVFTNGRAILDGYNNESCQFGYGLPEVTFTFYAGGGVQFSATGFTNNTAGIVSIIKNGASSSMAVNGGAATTGNAGTGATGGLTLLAKGNNGVPSATQLCELIAVTGTLDSTAYANTLAYLAAKWGITLVP